MRNFKLLERGIGYNFNEFYYWCFSLSEAVPKTVPHIFTYWLKDSNMNIINYNQVDLLRHLFYTESFL